MEVLSSKEYTDSVSKIGEAINRLNKFTHPFSLTLNILPISKFRVMMTVSEVIRNGCWLPACLLGADLTVLDPDRCRKSGFSELVKLLQTVPLAGVEGINRRLRHRNERHVTASLLTRGPFPAHLQPQRPNPLRLLCVIKSYHG